MARLQSGPENRKYDYYTFHLNAFNQETQKQDTLYLQNRSNYTQGALTMQFPFNISVKNYVRSVTSYVRYKIEAIHNNDIRKLYRLQVKDNIGYLYPAKPDNYHYSLPANYYQMLEYGLLFSNQTRMTTQEINPRWGQILQGGFAHTPLKKLNLGQEWWASGYFYFPGFFKTTPCMPMSAIRKNRITAVTAKEYYPREVSKSTGMNSAHSEAATRSLYSIPTSTSRPYFISKP